MLVQNGAIWRAMWLLLQKPLSVEHDATAENADTYLFLTEAADAPGEQGKCLTTFAHSHAT